MIKLISDEIDEFLQLLDMEYYTDESFYLHIAEDCDSIEDPTNNELAFGMFGNHNNHCYIAGNLELEQVLKSIAHEYMHFIQKDKGLEYNEEDAENFAELMYDKFNCEIRNIICDCEECKFCG